MRRPATRLFFLGLMLSSSAPVLAQVLTTADCVYFFNEPKAKVRNVCANVELELAWRIIGGQGCLFKGWGRRTLNSGAVKEVDIPPGCLVDYWVCDHDKYVAGTCSLPSATTETEEEDDARIRRAQYEARQDAATRKINGEDKIRSDRHAEQYRQQIDEETRIQKLKEQNEDEEREAAERQQQASQFLLQGLGAVLQGMNSQSQQPTQPAPSYSPPAPTYGGSPPTPQSGFVPTERSQVRTEPYKGSGSGRGTGYCKDVADGGVREPC